MIKCEKKNLKAIQLYKKGKGKELLSIVNLFRLSRGKTGAERKKLFIFRRL